MKIVLFIALAVVATLTYSQMRTVEAGRSTGRYQIVAEGGTSGGAWKIDTSTGAMWYCTLVKYRVECYPQRK